MQQNPCYNTTSLLMSGLNASDTRTQSIIYNTVEEETLLNGRSLRGGGGQSRERGGEERRELSDSA